MFPILRLRILILLTIILGGWAWVSIEPLLRSVEGTAGISLLDARAGAVLAIAMVILAGLPAIILGLLTSALGHPLSGIFSIACALTALAIAGGSMEGFLRTQSLPQAYRSLMIETVLWQLGVLAIVLLGVKSLSPKLRHWFSRWATDDHLGQSTHFALPDFNAVMSGLVSLGVAGFACHLLLRTSDSGQIIGGLIAAFALGGLVAQWIFPQANPIPVLLGPLLLSLIAYSCALFNFPTHESFLDAWYSQRLSGLALALPIHYASAGIAGAALGIGWAQALAMPENFESETDSASPSPSSHKA